MNLSLSALTGDRQTVCSQRQKNVKNTSGAALQLLQWSHASDQLCHTFSSQPQRIHPFSSWGSATLAQRGGQLSPLPVICLTFKIPSSLSGGAHRGGFVSQAEPCWCWELPHPSEVTPTHPHCSQSDAPTHMPTMKPTLSLRMKKKSSINQRKRVH